MPISKEPKVTFRVPGIGNVDPKDAAEAGKIIDRISEKIDAKDLEAIDRGVRKHENTPPVDETEEIAKLRDENERLKKQGNQRNTDSLMTRTRKLGGKIFGWASAIFTIGTYAYFAEDCASGFVKANPDASDKEATAVALGVTVYMMLTDSLVMPDNRLPAKTSPAYMAMARAMGGIGSIGPGSGAYSAMRASRENLPTDPTESLLEALGIADEVKEARLERETRQERKSLEKAEQEKAATARAIAKRNQRDYPASSKRGSVTPEEPDFGPVPDRDLRENFKRTNKIKKINIIIS